MPFRSPWLRCASCRSTIDPCQRLPGNPKGTKRMPSISSFLVPARRSLVAPVGRLCHTLDRLSRQVRDAVTRAISQAVAEAVRDILHCILEEPHLRSDTHTWSSDVSVRSPLSWERSRDDSWYEDVY